MSLSAPTNRSLLSSSAERKTHPHCQHVTAAATDRLRKSAYTILRGVSCEYDEGRLVLRGRLPSFFHKQLAQVAVSGLADVSQVVNQIEVIAAT